MLHSYAVFELPGSILMGACLFAFRAPSRLVYFIGEDSAVELDGSRFHAPLAFETLEEWAFEYAGTPPGLARAVRRHRVKTGLFIYGWIAKCFVCGLERRNVNPEITIRRVLAHLGTSGVVVHNRDLAHETLLACNHRVASAKVRLLAWSFKNKRKGRR